MLAGCRRLWTCGRARAPIGGVIGAENEESNRTNDYLLRALSEDVRELSEDVAELSKRLRNQAALEERVHTQGEEIKRLREVINADQGVRDRLTKLEASPSPRWLALLIATGGVLLVGLWQMAQWVSQIADWGSGP